MSDVVILWNADKGDILSRFARSLSNLTSWPIKRQPDPKARINYFFLYIQIGQNPKAVKGLNKTASLFSHFEEEVPQKVAWWNAAAPMVDIRLTWAQQYLDLLLPYGESYLVSPPIDAQFLKPRKPVIGVSGYVHAGGRKGEKLLKRLYQEKGNDYEIRATGVGWPVPNVSERPWADMPSFYESIDIYLVTSLTEGIPMPPLEALAMGKRVVAPIGVGLLDELQSPLVFRYERGSYDGMLEAIEAAAAFGKEDIATFSEDAWAQSHREAFGLTAGVNIVSKKPYKKPEIKQINADEYSDAFVPETPQMPVLSLPIVPQSGAVVVAYGKPARECAETMLKSWRKFMPEYPIALVSDAPLGIETLFIQHEDTDIGARSVKTQLYDIVPSDWQNVLYLDADTELVAPVPQIFHWLESGWDFIICTNPGLYASITQGARPDCKEELEVTISEIGSGEMIQWNGGVFGFHRSNNSAALMRAWGEEWKRYKGRDQFALLRALHKNPIKMLSLGNELNTITRFLDPEITAGILHHPLKARRWAGIIFGALDSKEAWDRVIE